MGIKIGQVNINGLSTNSVLALDRYITEKQLDIVCLSETKTRDLPFDRFTNMKTIIKPNTDNPKQRGVGLITKEDIQISRYQDLEPPTADMLVCVSKIGGHRYFICSVYSPPDNKAKLKEIMSAISKIQNQMSTLKVTGLLVVGDLNARHQAWGDHSHNTAGTEVQNFINNSNLHVVCEHNSPTFLCDNGSSHIDILITTSNLARLVSHQSTDMKVELFTGAPRRGHVPLITELTIQRQTSNQQKYYKWAKADWTKFEAVLESLCQQHMSTITSAQDPNIIWDTLKNILIYCKEECVPVGLVNSHNKPYWNSELSEISKRLRLAKTQFKHRSSYKNGDHLEAIKSEFKDALAAAQQSYLEVKSAKLNENNADQFWKGFKNVFYSKEDNTIEDLIDDDGTVLCEDESKAKHLFNSIFGSKSANTTTLDNRPRPHSFTPEYRRCLEELDRPISLEEISMAIGKLKTSRKSADFDGIHPLMLKQSTNFFFIALMCLFNSILKTHAWPWCTSNLVIFLRKPGKSSYNSSGSYRPITISSHVGKTLERVLENRLRAVVESWSLLPESQYGFRSKRGTLMYLHRLLSEATHHTRQKRPTAAIFLDLQKAFDTVPHHSMIQRLQELGIDGPFLQVIHAFLANRKISLKVNSYIHQAAKCEIGLPQGSVLSPLLFILYIRDMMTHTIGTSLQYADDCTLLITGSDSKDLQERCQQNLNTIHEWIEKWRLKINYQKTEIVVFNGTISPPTMGNSIIKISESSKVLGITIDKNLSFQEQRSNSVKSLEQKFNMLKPFVFAGLNCKSGRRILTQAILPKAMYAASLWDTTLKMSISQQLKLLLGAHYNPPTEALHILIDIPPLDLLYTRERLQLVRGLIKVKSVRILAETSKSHLTKTVTADLRKCVHRSVQLDNIQLADLTKQSINKCIEREWLRRWRAHIRDGMCPYGLLPQLPQESLLQQPIPLQTKQAELGALCDLLTGHSKLQQFQYRAGLSYSPLCTCVQDEETPAHYLYHCKDYESIRRKVNPSTNDWATVIQFIRLTKRFTTVSPTKTSYVSESINT